MCCYFLFLFFLSSFFSTFGIIICDLKIFPTGKYLSYCNLFLFFPLLRFPQRFFELFGGYHCKPTVVWAALQQMGIASISELSARLPLFTRGELHLFIAHFLRIRFPVILCLNKCDTPTSLNQVGRVKARFPHYVGECVSARLACQLLKLRAMCEQHHSLPTCNHPFGECLHFIPILFSLSCYCVL